MKRRSQGTFVRRSEEEERSGWRKKSFKVESDRLGVNCTRINGRGVPRGRSFLDVALERGSEMFIPVDF